MFKKSASAVMIGAPLMMTTALTAFADSHGAKTIGQTTALIPEAGLPAGELKDGESGNTNFPFANFKALATVGEVDAETGVALTGYPDGQAAWLADEDTVRVTYQSESYATMGSAPQPETYPQEMSNGVTFTGSHIHTIDFDRAAFAEFMNNEDAAATMVKGSGFCSTPFTTHSVKWPPSQHSILPIWPENGATRLVPTARSSRSTLTTGSPRRTISSSPSAAHGTSRPTNTAKAWALPMTFG